jgi:hypothetical protein
MLAEYGTMRRDGIIVQYYLTRMRACMHAALAVPDRSLAGGNRLLTRMHACMHGNRNRLLCCSVFGSVR